MNTDRDTILTAAANGNAAALEFLRVFARRAHWVDDVCDRDKLDAGSTYAAARFAEEEADWLLCLSSNPFFLAHRAQLVPVMVLALNAWADSELPFQFKQGGGQEQQEHWATRRDVIKGQWHEVVWLVAFLTGGPQHLRSVSGQFREYDFEPDSAMRDAQSELRKEPDGTVRR